MRKILLVILVLIYSSAVFGNVATMSEFDMFFVKNGISKPTFFDVNTGLETSYLEFPPYTGTETTLTSKIGLEWVIYATNYSLYLYFIDNTGNYFSGYMLSGADEESIGNYNYSVVFNSDDVSGVNQINVTDAEVSREINDRRINIFEMNSTDTENSNHDVVSAISGSGILTCTLKTPTKGFKQGQYSGYIVCVLTTE